MQSIKIHRMIVPPLTLLALAEELPDPIEGRGRLHVVLDPLLYPLVLVPHGRELALLVLEALLHVVPVAPGLYQTLHLRYREHVVLEVRDDLEQLVLGTLASPAAAAGAGPARSRAQLVDAGTAALAGRRCFRGWSVVDRTRGRSRWGRGC